MDDQAFPFREHRARQQSHLVLMMTQDHLPRLRGGEMPDAVDMIRPASGSIRPSGKINVVGGLEPKPSSAISVIQKGGS